LKKDYIFCVLVLGLSTLNIFNNQSNILTLTVGLSIIGVLGVISYFLKLKYFKYLFLAWILGQFINVEFSETINGVKTITDSFNLNQIIDLKIGLNIGMTQSVYIGLNIIPFAFLGLYKLLLSNSHIGEFVTIIPLRKMSPLYTFSPIKIEIIDVLKNSEFVGALNPPIIIENETFDRIFFKLSNKSIFKLDKTRELCDIKLKNKNKVIETNGFIE